MKALLFAITSAFVFSASSAGVPADTAWIKLYYSLPYRLRGNSVTDTINIPYKITDPSVQGAQVKIENDSAVYIRKESSFEQSYRDAFTILLDIPSSRLRIVVNMKALREEGTYEMMLAFTAPSRRIEIPVSFIRPAALFTADTPIKITIRENLFSGPEVKGDPFVIRETGGLSSIDRLFLAQPVFIQVKERGLVTFSDSGYIIPANSYLHAEYEVDKQIAGKLPVGEKISGTLKVSAPEAATPVTVSFEIMRVRSKSLIILFVFLGILSGFFVRTYIHNQRELDEKRIFAGELLQRIRKETAVIRDEDYIKKIRGITEDLENLLLEKSSIFPRKESLVTSIITKTETTTNGYNQAKDEFAKDFEKTQEQIKKLGFLLQNPALPEEIRDQLEAANESYQKAVAELAVFDLTNAKEHLGLAMDEIKSFLEKYVKSVTKLAEQIEAGEIMPTVTPEELKKNIKAVAVEIKKHLPELVINEAKQELAEPALKKLIEVEANLKRMFDSLLEKITSLYTRDFKDDDSDQMNDFRDQFNAWKTTINRILSNPLESFDPAVTDTLNNAWDAIPERGFAGKILGPSHELTITNHPGWLERSLSKSGINFIKKDFNSDPIERVIRQAKSNWLLLSVVKTLFIFILLALAAYNFYSNDFTGTFSQLFGMFIAAFSIDITIDNVIAFPGKKS